ncbi:type II restriction endonuclease subunit M [Vibrio alginolyticus]|uniref:N-6 DNA methylase n=1 Tax=Pseudoalteromonas shioyasakiensis TaxID=1190813 RepID=UPI0014359285|nr:N-6 DNA methylase [Pseudoalteromonas shioyasakiensis]BCB41452.1 type II restriction endonuclease subunit M [Vibrio alginolyticus]MDK9682150.1 N-6 DNA methylase [Pseudoalteromonas shioyasakiensis]BCB46052.1 type II restriction endonuclease subunit M [Vibrio alginolyticus]BCB50653.1 type II restriction endonuclease subunit M [Vibrio alginolyticus]BCB55256.1 type II restriction endonuclease subunit M [Vibrio alginolyticus]
MAKKEVKTDYWVKSLLDEASVSLEPQGSSIVEINEALKTASKKGTGRVGFPEFVGVVKDFLIVIEDKADLSKHLKLDESGLLSTNTKDIGAYALNGALFYGQHLAANTTYKKVIAFGISGDEKKHRITPIYIDETEYYRELPDVESFITFNEDNIDEYYIREVLKEETDEDKEVSEILKDAAELHEDLRNYGSLKDIDKPLVVSGILLALREAEFRNFSIDELTGDSIKTDGDKIYDAISSNLIRANVSPEVKKDKILSQFAIIKNTQVLNEVNDRLGKTPLKHYAEFLNDKIYRNIRFVNSSEDYLGRFYGEFMSYSGGDGQTLGIVLTPKHIADLFCELTELSEEDVVLDPCCGTGGFLVAALHHMLSQTSDDQKRKHIKQKSLHGLELQPYMFTIATTNMILRGDGKSNLINENFLKQDSNKLQLKQPTVGMMNPPYSQGSKQNPELYELSFTEHMLDSLTEGARAIVIVPQSSMTGKSKEEKLLKQNILKHHTLEGVITLNADTFYGVGTLPCIAIFTAGEPHPKNKEAKFINFKDDGFIVKPHIGLVETEQGKDRKQHLLDVWFDRIEAETKFCVSSTVEATDEWLHGYYYFNDEPATDSEFEKVIEDYLSFEFSMLIQGKESLFSKSEKLTHKGIPDLLDMTWKEFFLTELFPKIQRGKRLKKADQIEGDMPYVSSTAMNNGVDNYVSNDNKVRIYEKCLTIANSGSVGASFYHDYKFVASDHVTHLKNPEFNKYIYLFTSGLTNRLSEKYNFNREINDPRISREKVVLPVNSDENPDYEYMEQYIKNLMIAKYKKYKTLFNTVNV